MIVRTLVDAFELFPCGVDVRRFVLMSQARHWMVVNENYAFFPRPWTYLDGEVNYHILRWMSEAVLVLLLDKPGTLLDDLIKSFSFAVQPILIEELLGLLEYIGCCQFFIKPMNTMYKTSPFSGNFCTFFLKKSF